MGLGLTDGMTQPSIAPDLAWLIDVLWGDEGVRFHTAGDAGAELSRDPECPACPSLRTGEPGRWTRRARGRIDGEVGGLSARPRGGRAGLSARPWPASCSVTGSGGADPLLDALASSIGEAPIALAAAVRRPGPFRKPVLQVVTPDGRVVAYAKVAWNDVTGTNIRAEHAGSSCSRPPTRRRPAPRPRSRSSSTEGFPCWSPIPCRSACALRGVRGRARCARLARGGCAAVARGNWVRSDRRSPAPPIRRGTGASSARPRCDRRAARRDRAPIRRPALGVWHGDWSPWNLGWVGEQLWAWDWEYCRADVPVGLDLPHFTFQQRFIGDQVPVQDAFAAARSACAAALSALGYAAAARSVLHAVHVAEVSLRYLEAEAAGVTANPRFLAGAVPALRAAADAL